MTIQEGGKIPSVTVKATDMSDVTTDELFKGLPGYIEKADEIRAKGVDDIICMSVNDAFVMDAWSKDRGAGEKVRLIADGNGDLAKALGLEMDGTGIGFGLRCQRFAAIVDDGTITKLAVEEPMKFEVSSAEAILAAL
jgi:peroxiredoxin